MLLVACSSSSPQPAKTDQPAAPSSAASSPVSGPTTHVVTIKDMKFSPESFTIHEGDTIEWKNADDVAHNAVANDKTFATQKLKPGDSEKLVANKKGSFPYVFTFHPNMKATVDVQ
jgi:plastocyanin